MVGKVLIAINPYKDLTDIYSDTQISKYRNEPVDTLSPHIYLIGEYLIVQIGANLS